MSIFNENDRRVKKLKKIADKIEALAETYKKMDDEELVSQTDKLKARLQAGETLDDILPEAFATAREAAERVLGMRHFYVQLLGGIALHQGRIAEMATGEGKTLVATLPAYLNALAGKGVHIVTVNDYLATRDASWMGKLYKFLGLSVGVIVHGMKGEEKRAAYNCDITYCTNNELGFDFLRDNMALQKAQKVQRELNFAIVDEVDSILIDEARTPLIISGDGGATSELYESADMFAKQCVAGENVYTDNSLKGRVSEKLNKIDEKAKADENNESDEEKKKQGDFIIDEEKKTIMLTDLGVAKAEEFFKPPVPQYDENGNEIEFSITKLENADLYHAIQQALKANYLMKKDRDYIVNDEEVLIVDEFTGRILIGRRFSDGLHQAIEAKEGVTIHSENKTLATITLQNFFRMYTKLSGMTGTAKTEEEEFKGIYSLDVVTIPPNKPSQRKDENDVLYPKESSKFAAIVNDIKKCKEKGQPVLVGTVSVEKSEMLSAILKREHIDHKVLNAKNHKQESEIIAQAGKSGAITIATNMAGRGTDIMLGGNAEFQAKQKMEKDGYDLETIELASSPHASDDPKIIEAKKVYKHHYDDFKAICDKDKEEVLKAGGLRIIGTERHESRRIDNQLRGRAGRQGDPGSTIFYVSLEDDIVRIFGRERIEKLKSMYQVAQFPDDMPITLSLFSKAIENAQRALESRNYSVRKQVLSYDDVMNQQREIIYKERGKVLDGLDLHEQIIDMIGELAEDIIETYADYKTDYNTWNYEAFNNELERRMLPEGSNVMNAELCSCFDVYKLKDAVLEIALEEYKKKTEMCESIGAADDMKEFERYVLLQTVDAKWREHIDAMSVLRSGISLRGYGQRDPVLAYRQEGWDMFEEMVRNIHTETASILLKFQLKKREADEPPVRRILPRAIRRNNKMRNQNMKNAGKGMTYVREDKEIGRNDPCPCGSGKKYKNCCGRNV